MRSVDNPDEEGGKDISRQSDIEKVLWHMQRHHDIKHLKHKQSE